MTTYDEESILADVKAILVSNLNDKIAAIEAEKIALGFPATGLAAIDTVSGYIQQSLSAFPFNISPALFFGLDATPPVNSPGLKTARKIKIFVEVLIVDSQTDNLMPTRINRYARAVREVLEDNWDQLGIPFRMNVDTVWPISFRRDENSSEEIWVGGASLNLVMI